MTREQELKPLNSEQIEKLRIAGKKLAEIFRDLREKVVAGVSEKELDKWVEQQILEKGCEITYKTAEVNFPGAICISVNDEIVHSPPTDYILQNGDLVSFDLVIGYEGIHADSAFSMIVGEEPSGAKKILLNNTERSLYDGISQIHGPVWTKNIAKGVENTLKKAKLGIVRDLVGHGIGESMHQAPEVPNFTDKHINDLVPAGYAIAIEPMATLGKADIIQDKNDGWTIRTRDGSLAAHFEHTVLITDDGYEIITKL